MKQAFCTFAVLAAVLVLASVAWGKKYETGTLTQVVTASGWVDTTACATDTVNRIQCTPGGIREAFELAYWLTLSDGTRVLLHHAPLSRNVITHMDLSQGPASVQYRIECKMGQTFIIVVDPVSGKEGKYYGDIPKAAK